MKSIIHINSKRYVVDLNRPLEIALLMQVGKENPRAWYVGAPKIEPIKDGDWVAAVSKGARINFNSITFSPHAHGTHTESYGHISKTFYPVSDCLQRFFFTAKLISVAPEKRGGDQVITKESLQNHLQKGETEALVIRTLPNQEQKKNRHYDHTNWPYLEASAAAYIRECGVTHLLIDLPSVDREEGDVVAHRAFWDYPKNPRKHATITEFIYVADAIKDGDYLLNLQVARFKNNAAPSRPVLYAVSKDKND